MEVGTEDGCEASEQPTVKRGANQNASVSCPHVFSPCSSDVIITSQLFALDIAVIVSSAARCAKKPCSRSNSTSSCNNKPTAACSSSDFSLVFIGVIGTHEKGEDSIEIP